MVGIQPSFFVSTLRPQGSELGVGHCSALQMQATLSRALAFALLCVCGVLTGLGLCWSWLLHQVTDWRFPQQNWSPWKWRRRKRKLGWGAFGPSLAASSPLSPPPHHVGVRILHPTRPDFPLPLFWKRERWGRQRGGGGEAGQVGPPAKWCSDTSLLWKLSEKTRDVERLLRRTPGERKPVGRPMFFFGSTLASLWNTF